MKLSDSTRRKLIFRVLERCNLPSHALRDFTVTKYCVDLFPLPDSVIFPKDANPIKLERMIRSYQKQANKSL